MIAWNEAQDRRGRIPWLNWLEALVRSASRRFTGILPVAERAGSPFHNEPAGRHCETGILPVPEGLRPSGPGIARGKRQRRLTTKPRVATRCNDADYWMVKADATGTKLWEQSFGATNGVDYLTSVLSTEDGGILLGGVSQSGGADFWVIKLAGPAPELAEPAPELAISLSTDSVRLSWPLAAADWTLEQSETMESAAGWVPIPVPYQSNAAGFFHAVPNPDGRGFFRMSKP